MMMIMIDNDNDNNNICKAMENDSHQRKLHRKLQQNYTNTAGLKRSKKLSWKFVPTNRVLRQSQ